MSIVREAEPLFSQQLEHCRKLSELYPRDETVSKALDSAQKSLTLLTRFDSSVALVTKPASEALQTYTQSVLDSTYHQECRLVEGNFPDDIASTEITAIIDSIGRPVSLCGAGENIQPTLGTDQYECISWRVGALMYMYVHELMSNESRRKATSSVFIRECCVVGVCHLGLLLSARVPLDPQEDYSANDDTLAQLLQEGIFSDVHMLALMYAGEMCYWAWKISSDDRGRRGQGEEKETGGGSGVVETPNGVAQAREQPAMPLFSGLISLVKGREYLEKYCAEFLPVEMGQSLLRRYIKLAQGPLKSRNWNYARAVQLVVELKRS